MDQLAQLKDIHLPEEIAQWPYALGWWLLLALVIAIITIFFKKYIKQRKFNCVKRQAINQLTRNKNLNTEQCMSILKWACIHYYSRQDVAAKHGNELNKFLTSKLNEQHKAYFTKRATEAFNQYYRRSNIDIYAEEFYQATLYWFKHANLVDKKINKGARS